MRLLPAVAAVLLLCACANPVAPEPVAEPPTGRITDVRHGALPVPAGLALETLQFADAEHGYAQLIAREPAAGGRHRSALAATTDGGRSWHALSDPRRGGMSPQLYIVDAKTLVLLDGPDDWFVSTDQGASFMARPPGAAPPELSAGTTYELVCPQSCVVHAIDGHRMTAPPIPGDLQAVLAVGGSVWVASLEGQVPHTARSRDGGRSWEAFAVPPRPDLRPERLTLKASVDGADVWLIGTPGGGVAGMGEALALRRKDVGVPILWLLGRDRWAVKGATGAPKPTLQPYSVAAIGGGLAAVQGVSGLALVDDAWHAQDLSPPPAWVSVLADGTIAVTTASAGTVLLGRRDGTAVHWVEVVADVVAKQT